MKKPMLHTSARHEPIYRKIKTDTSTNLDQPERTLQGRSGFTKSLSEETSLELRLERVNRTDGRLLLSLEVTNQNSLFRSRNWLSANHRPVFPDSVGSWNTDNTTHNTSAE
eukprot:sb/3477137/